jgi:adenylylsulfate kinase
MSHNAGIDSDITLKNIVWCSHLEKRALRENNQAHQGLIVWLTGLSGSGKSTIASNIDTNLSNTGIQTIVLDGDNLRHGLCNDLGFSIADRNENVRRVGEVARLFLEQGFVVVVALVSPILETRDKVKHSFAESDFVEVYCNCSLSTCRERDAKGLYAKAEKGKISDFTGVSSPYEEPLSADLTLYTDAESVSESVDRLMQLVVSKVKLKR